ncbi:MAG TPA: sigma-54 dependent transcriptional regulator [Bryobacteraceae bacterium]|nr:sigma-54 dependent transcriptional regulator [Bryobacteraceae bacterium]
MSSPILTPATSSPAFGAAAAGFAPRVLRIADRPDETIGGILRSSMVTADSAAEALDLLRADDFDVVLVSLPLAGCESGAEFAIAADALLEELQRAQPRTPVVIHAPAASSTEVVRLLHLGAFHVYTHGDPTSLLYLAANSKWSQADTSLAMECDLAPWRRLLIGASRPMQQIAQQIQLVAPRRSTVLITGETGTGKELVARSIHAASGRSRSNLVAVNCSALPEALLEAELFGHVKGAFTGAVGLRVGRFEEANHGTIFLDEIGDMPFSLQAKLLRALQEREFQRLGSSETIRVDVRVVAATHTDLAELVKQGKFREDLYYRLNVVPIALPALRERPSDIPALVHHFIEKICRDEYISPKQISQETLARLSSYEWPGNVRQLENAVEKAIVLSGERANLLPGDFPLPPRRPPIAFAPTNRALISVPDHGLDFERTVGSIELHILEQALRKTHGNKKLAAEMLGLKRTTLAAKLKSLAAVGAAG